VGQQSTARSFLQHLRISVGNGTKTRFWNDQWVGNYALKDKFPNLFSLSSQQAALFSAMGWFEGHVWKWSLAWKRRLVQQEVQSVEELIALLTIYHPLPNQVDTLLWKDKKEFSAKILQQLVSMEMAVEVESVVCSVWMNLAPLKWSFSCGCLYWARSTPKSCCARKVYCQRTKILAHSVKLTQKAWIRSY